MKYQALKRLKTKSKLLKLCDTLQEAHDTIKNDGGTFREFSYIGRFPVYTNDENNRYYSIQGLHEQLGMVLSLSDDELQAFNFNQ